MKTFTRLTAIVVIAVLTFLKAHAGSFPPQLNGSMMPFDFSRCDSTVPWDSGMTPVFINYMARHGARFLSSEKKVESLKKELAKARSEGYLTDKGIQFMTLLQQVDSVTAGDWGALNAVGKHEEKRLGEMMVNTVPELLEKGRVEAIATYVPRVVMTMYELCHELSRHSSYLEISASEGREYNPLLRFFTTDTTYVDYLKKGDWLSAYDRFVDTNVSTLPAQSLFSQNMEPEKMRKLTLDMYGVLQSLPAAQLPWEPERWFSETEYRTCWEAANLKHYYQRSANAFSDLPAISARRLLDDIINTTDSAADGKSDGIIAKLRFGHAETVMPLFALMQLPGCYYPEGNANEISAYWKDWEVSPLGANLLIVLLKDSKGDPYVSLRLNGRWLTLRYKDGSGIKSGNVIPWHDLRSQWTE